MSRLNVSARPSRSDDPPSPWSRRGTSPLPRSQEREFHIFQRSALFPLLLRLPLLHRLDGFVCSPDRVGEKRVVNECRLIAVAPLRMLWRSRRIFRDRHLEPLLEQFAQMRFDAHIGEHSTENDLADLAFAELENEVVGLWPKHAMRRDDNSLAVFDVRLKPLQPVRAGSFETIEIQDSFASEHPRVHLIGFERSVKFPACVGGIEIVRRNKHLEAMRLRGLEDTLHVLDGVVLSQTVADQGPSQASFIQHLILRVDHYYGGVVLGDVHGFPFGITWS